MQQVIAEDELDLYSVWIALVRWKYVLAGLIVLGGTCGSVLGFLSPRLYESEAAIQIGRVGDLGSVQRGSELVQQIRQARTAGETPPRVSLVEEIADGMLLMAAQATTAEDSQAFLQRELEEILAAHSALFEEATKRKGEARDVLVARIAMLETQAQELARRAEAVAPRDPALSAVLTHDSVRLTTELSALDQTLAALDLELTNIRTSPTRVVREPTLPTEPLGRSWLFWAMAGAAVGLAAGIVATFLLEARYGWRA